MVLTSPEILAEWHGLNGPSSVQGLTTTRHTSVETLELPSEPKWLRQVHGTRVIASDQWCPGVEADGIWTQTVGEVVAIRTADCLPFLITDEDQSLVAAVHAGWRGLAQEIIASTVEALPVEPHRLRVWIGPAISASAFEVGRDVWEAFVGGNSAWSVYFRPHGPDHWWADLVGIARAQWAQWGVQEVEWCGLCTVKHHTELHSYRAGLALGEESGRMASLIWLG